MKIRFIHSAAVLLAVSIPCFSAAITAHNSVPVVSTTVAATTPAAASRATMQMTLSAEKKVVRTDESGKEIVKWNPMSGTENVGPGEVVRYTVTGVNSGDHAVSNLAVTQPIPSGTHYVLYSATADTNSPTRALYSINQGHSFTARPMVRHTFADGSTKVQPARAESYTHVRWTFGQPVAPASTVKVSFQVMVQ